MHGHNYLLCLLSYVYNVIFCRYMYRRCAFLDVLPAFCFNEGVGDTTSKLEDGKPVVDKTTNTKELGSTLMKAMLSEVKEFYDTHQNWIDKAHHQVCS